MKKQKLLFSTLITSLLIIHPPLSFCHSEINNDLLLFPFVEAKYSSNLDPAVSLDEDEYDFGADIFATFEYKKFRFLGEYLLSKHEKDFERLQFGWLFNNNNTVWLGRFHNPIGFWNTNYHHADYLEAAITRPAIVEYEDFGGILPMHLAGMLVEGSIENANHGWGYSASIAGGPLITDELEPWSVTSPKSGTRDISLGFNLYYEPALFEPSRYGIFINYNEIPAGQSGFEEIQQIISGAYLNWEFKQWHAISSVFFVHNELERITGVTSSEMFVSGYVQLEYAFNDKFTLYGRLEDTVDEQNDLYLGLFPDFIDERIMGGFRFDVYKQNALKLELSNNQTSRDHFPQLMLQWSSFF